MQVVHRMQVAHKMQVVHHKILQFLVPTHTCERARKGLRTFLLLHRVSGEKSQVWWALLQIRLLLFFPSMHQSTTSILVLLGPLSRLGVEVLLQRTSLGILAQFRVGRFPLQPSQPLIRTIHWVVSSGGSGGRQGLLHQPHLQLLSGNGG